jgi:magnesium chelatase family protein
MEEVLAAHGALGEAFRGHRPFRELGGEQLPRLCRPDPHTGLWGELSLAHRGLLFVNGLGEKLSATLERLQEPVSAGELRSFRAGRIQHQPAQWVLVGFDPACGCGGGGGRAPFPCRCLPSERERFAHRLERARSFFPLHYSLSEPILAPGISCEAAQVAVALAEKRRKGRQQGPNSRLALRDIFPLKPWAPDALQAWKVSGGARADGKTLTASLALTISDLRGAEAVSRADVMEARHYSCASGATVPSGKSLRKAGFSVMNSTAMP